MATRRVTSARACSRPSPTSTARSRRRCRASTRPTRPDSTRRLIDLDGTPNKGRLGANALLGVSLANAHAVAAVAAACRCGSISPATARRDAAGADDEHHQRRRACRQQRRPAGIHGPAGRLRFVLRSAARRRGNLPRAEVRAERPRPGTAVGDEGGFAPDLQSQRGSARDDPRSDRQGRLQGRRRRLLGLDVGQLASSTRTASTTWKARASA